jgi:UTP--glucose-1-phosphate uridylyltransferase
MALADELAGLDTVTVELLQRYHFDRERLLRLAARLQAPSPALNYVRGKIEPLPSGKLRRLPERDSEQGRRLESRGLAALQNGEVAMVVLAGGMATRMGGIVKALVPALAEQTFLELRLNEARHLAARAGRAVPLWLMSSYATHGALIEALGSRLHGDARRGDDTGFEGDTRVEGDALAVFPQQVSLRLTREGSLFRGKDGQVSLYATGHGDLLDALEFSGLLRRFLKRGGRYLTVGNLDNLGAGIDPWILGHQIESGAVALCEVVEKIGSDRGGIPVLLDGRPVVLEEFRIPPSFDPAAVRVFNTNTFHFDASALAGLKVDWTFFAVEKAVESTRVIQFERLLGELTSHLDTEFIEVPRAGAGSRFLPVKDFDELAARQAEIAEVGQARGMSPPSEA